MPSQQLNAEVARHVATSEPQRSENGKPPTSLFASYLRLLREFRQRDLSKFCDEHDRLYKQAKKSGDHTTVTQHYYGLMASVIATYYGEGWHFCPPEHQGQSRRDATVALYQRVARTLELDSSKHCLDIGCGVGGMMRFLTRETGARLSGITLGENEVEDANRIAKAEKLDSRCVVVQGDSQQMPFPDKCFDSAYAVYALKYYPSLDRIFREIHRVLKPGGKFVAYCLCKSKEYRETNKTHARLLSEFEYSTAMPSLHSVQSMMAAGADFGLDCITEQDISNGVLNWYSYWVSNPLLPWLVSSRAIYGITRTAEAVRILPPGFARFNDRFLAGTLRHIIRGGRMGVLTGSALLTFEKR